MPTVLRIGAYRFFFYSGDWKEPHHIHVERDDSKAKFWLDPVRLDKRRYRVCGGIIHGSKHMYGSHPNGADLSTVFDPGSAGASPSQWRTQRLGIKQG